MGRGTGPPHTCLTWGLAPLHACSPGLFTYFCLHPPGQEPLDRKEIPGKCLLDGQVDMHEDTRQMLLVQALTHRPGNGRRGRLGAAFGELGLCTEILTWRQLPQLARG